MEYIVDDASSDASVVLLRDRTGRRHVARVAADAPAIGSCLYGLGPSLGFALLIGAASGQVFRVTFELTDCSAPAAAGRMQLERPFVLQRTDRQPHREQTRPY
jgi:hypothetical protein